MEFTGNENLDHNRLVRIGKKWLSKHDQNIIVPNCSTVIAELTSATETGEIPDVLGWASWCSVLLEIKVSRPDFLKDKNKTFRKQNNLGVGDLRYYLCPAHLIEEEDLPEGWGLLWYREETGVEIIKKATKLESNLHCERTLLLSYLRRYKKSAEVTLTV